VSAPHTATGLFAPHTGSPAPQTIVLQAYKPLIKRKRELYGIYGAQTWAGARSAERRSLPAAWAEQSNIIYLPHGRWISRAVGTQDALLRWLGLSGAMLFMYTPPVQRRPKAALREGGGVFEGLVGAVRKKIILKVLTKVLFLAEWF
jgi:hypothetical protein